MGLSDNKQALAVMTGLGIFGGGLLLTVQGNQPIGVSLIGVGLGVLGAKEALGGVAPATG